MARGRDSRLDIMLRTWWARALAALLIAVIAVFGWLAGFRYFRDELRLEFLAYPVGIGVAIGAYLTIGYVYRQFGPKALPLHLTGGALADRAVAQLSQLQPITHFIHPLSRSSWPTSVSGPGGVYVVDVKPVPGHIGYVNGEIRVNGGPPPAEWIGDVRRLVPVVRELLHDSRGIEVPVAGVIVVDEATIVPPALKAGNAEISVVPVNELADHLTFGASVTLEKAQAAHAALAAWRPAG